MRRSRTTLVVLLLLTGVLQGCALAPRQCHVAIAALGRDPSVLPGEPIPDDLAVIAEPRDIDPAGTAWHIDDGGGTFEITLRDDAVARLANHTAAHTGEYLVIAVDGQVVAVPSILAPIPDGRVQITIPESDVPETAARLAGCAR